MDAAARLGIIAFLPRSPPRPSGSCRRRCLIGSLSVKWGSGDLIWGWGFVRMGALSRPEEVVALVKLRVAAGQIKRQIPPEEHWAFCYDMLQKVSRSFALVIQQLGPELRNAVCIFYAWGVLSCQVHNFLSVLRPTTLTVITTATAEDDTSVANDVKLPILVDFYRHINYRSALLIAGAWEDQRRSLLPTNPWDGSTPIPLRRAQGCSGRRQRAGMAQSRTPGPERRPFGPARRLPPTSAGKVARGSTIDSGSSSGALHGARSDRCLGSDGDEFRASTFFGGDAGEGAVVDA
ncbi:hypothetical protein QYE76_049270 [Lolium multiflorum]|uniref:Uncharacterized protein n=1 Tax=Lolium multiflorum TaxID=4521 RepID=A0AAD8SP06_LOLMU|nr:hypothetical protein QYE76_049268 [Lolium multiflorum]KAK1661111.1 hypothetical protein QYE76_049270 [Lolium multiflorum]